MLQSATLDIDLSALRHNLARVTARAAGREVIASVKANAYGFGVVGISRELVACGVKKLWTGNVREALELRAAGIDAEILMFGGPPPSLTEDLLSHNLQPTIFDETGLLSAISAAAACGIRAPILVKIDAGLGRLGVPIGRALAFIERVAASPELDLRGVYTHLPFSTAEGAVWAHAQYSSFARLVAVLGERGIDVPMTQVWGSAGLLSDMPDVSNAVCVGHALFGLDPLFPRSDHSSDLRPIVAALSANILRVEARAAEGGRGAGYGSQPGGTIATIAIGLGDGLRKATGHPAHVIIGGERSPVTGFTLEHLMVDVSGAPAPSLFDAALVIGTSGEARISLDDWAQWVGVSPLEVMLSLSGRTDVRYVYETGSKG